MSTDQVASSKHAAMAREPLRRTCGAGIRTAALALLMAAIPVARGGSPTAAPTVDELKSAYLSCNRAAAGTRLSSGTIMQCSIVYEELKQRAFGDDFERLLAWSKAMDLTAVAERSPRSK